MMAQRKDMMRIIRQDAGFSAKLGFGGNVGTSVRIPTYPVGRSDNIRSAIPGYPAT